MNGAEAAQTGGHQGHLTARTVLEKYFFLGLLECSRKIFLAL